MFKKGKLMIRLSRLATIGLLSLSFSGAALAADTPSLYQRLGGKGALTAVVNELWAVVAADTRINARFAHTKPEAFGGQLVDFLCQASGGPCKYQGQDMKTAHTGMKLDDADFNALAEDTVKALDKFKVPATEKGEVMNLLGSLKGDVINR
jgi:hemoglobin